MDSPKFFKLDAPVHSLFHEQAKSIVAIQVRNKIISKILTNSISRAANTVHVNFCQYICCYSFCSLALLKPLLSKAEIALKREDSLLYPPFHLCNIYLHSHYFWRQNQPSGTEFYWKKKIVLPSSLTSSNLMHCERIEILAKMPS